MAAAACALTPAAAAAQRFVAATGSAQAVEYRLDAGFGLERYTGLVARGGMTLEIRAPFELAVDVGLGRLAGRTAGALDRDVGQLGIAARVHLADWLVGESGLIVRAFGTDLARQRWVVLGVGGEARLPFLGGAMQGVARAAYLPGVWVNGLQQPDLAFTAAAGLELRRGRVRARLLSLLERYDFAARPEQLSALGLEVDVSLRR